MYSNGLKYLCCTTEMTYTQTAIIMNKYNELRFSKIITANNRMKPQPAPDSIYHIMDKLNMYDYNVVIIGNTVDDIKEGNNAKVKSIGVSQDNEICNELIENGADYTINNLYYLPKVIKEINKITYF
jgi:phosphoglycolate phosphatase-like HAD superfamily hydrolase